VWLGRAERRERDSRTTEEPGHVTARRTTKKDTRTVSAHKRLGAIQACVLPLLCCSSNELFPTP
jgi:hypothetical protein